MSIYNCYIIYKTISRLIEFQPINYNLFFETINYKCIIYSSIMAYFYKFATTPACSKKKGEIKHITKILDFVSDFGE